MCGFLYVNVARRNCPVTLHCVTLLRERALLYKARVRYKSRHSDQKKPRGMCGFLYVNVLAK